MAGEQSRLWESPALWEVLDWPPASLETGERVRTERQGLCVGFSNLLRRIAQPFRRRKPASVLCLQRQCSVPSLRELKTVFLISVVPKLPGREGHSIFFLFLLLITSHTEEYYKYLLLKLVVFLAAGVK